MRRAVRGEVLAEVPKGKRGGKRAKNGTQEPNQLCLAFVDPNTPAKLWEYAVARTYDALHRPPNTPAKLWEYAVLVTNADYKVEHIGQLYRDRADCENGFDELKNQWGWGGYSTQDIERCNLFRTGRSAGLQLVELVCPVQLWRRVNRGI